MSTKKIIFLVTITVFSLNARWRVKAIKNKSDLSLKDAEAYYGKDQSLDRLTTALQNSNGKTVKISSADGAIGKKSQGFNCLKFPDGIQLDLDSVDAHRLNRGRVKAESIDPNLGKHSSLTGYVARAEMKNGDDVIDSDYQNHDAEGEAYTLVISGKNGNYSLSLE